MPQTANRKRAPQQKQVKDVLEDADPSKQQRFREKLSEFMRDKEWSRDTWEQDLKDLENTLETVEELITDLQTDINRLEGNGDFNDQKQQIISEYGNDNLKDLQEKGSSRFTPYLKELHDIEERKKENYKKMLQWKEYENLLKEVAKRKLEGVATTYKEDYQDSEVAKRMLDYLDQKQDIFEDKLETEINTKVDRKFTEMEGRVNQLEKDVDRFDKRMTSFRSMIEDLVEGLSKVVRQNSTIEKVSNKLENIDEKAAQAQQEEVEQETEPVEQEEVEQDKEEVAESFEEVEEEDDQQTGLSPGNDAIEPTDQVTAEDLDMPEQTESSEEGNDVSEEFEAFDEDELPVDISDEDVETKYEMIGRLNETIDFEAVSQQEIADKLGVSRPQLLNYELKEVYQEFGTVFEITTRDYSEGDE